MGIYYQDPMVTLYQGDVRAVLRGLEAESVQTVVTSPPYWSLRDYGIEPSVWGGDGGCGHEWASEEVPARHSDDGITGSTLQGSKATQAIAQRTPTCSATCLRCGAWRGALGLEPTPELFIEHMVEVFREVRRVMRRDGTLWLNIGDSYAGSWGAQGHRDSSTNGENISRNQIANHPKFARNTGYSGGEIKPKDLVGIPWMLAFALRADGWWLRQDIIWHKPNPMPESVTDRCTKSHEYLFLLTKAERYFFDADAIREAHDDKAGDVSRFGNTGVDGGYQGGSVHGTDGFRRESFAIASGGRVYNPAGRNKRSVWTIATEPFPEAHFATFPQALVRPCLLAGTSERGACAECGAPWERVVERETAIAVGPRGTGSTEVARAVNGGQADRPLHGGAEWYQNANRSTTLGWRPTCAHTDAPAVPCTVLDPFSGSGTAALVAKSLGRRAIGIDMNPEYLAMARKRIERVALPMLLEAP